MNVLTRRSFLTLTGAGMVAVAASGIALAVRQLSERGNTLAFQAVTGLPSKPLLSYASFAISGKVNTSNGTGTITKNVYAGPPESMTTIQLYTRTVRVTDVTGQGSTWRIKGVVENQAHLQKGEDSSFELLLDSSHSTAQSTFFGSSVQMQLQRFALS